MSARRNVTRAGATLYCEWYDSAQYDAGGKLASVLSLVLDVTDRVRAEAALLSFLWERSGTGPSCRTQRARSGHGQRSGL